MRVVLSCLILAGLTQAAQVYLSPQPHSFPSQLPSKRASFVLAHHLGLDQFEVLGDNLVDYAGLLGERNFVGEGPSDGLLLVIDESVAKDVIPTTMEPSFSAALKPALGYSPQPENLHWLVSGFVKRAQHAYTTVFSTFTSDSTKGVPRVLDIFDASSASSREFVTQAAALFEFIDSEVPYDKFGAVELTGLTELASTYGRDSEQYQTASNVIRAAIESVLAQPKARLAIATSENTSVLSRRQQPPQQSPFPPQNPGLPPMTRPTTCLTTVSACNNATNSCSGHGQCSSVQSAGQECFVCACGITTSDSGRTTTWAGDRCEKKDVSGAFALIAGTVISLLLLIVGSISLLSSIGATELPSILMGGGHGAAKRD
ncbi:hypothetical protein CONPUDRAFT_164352 [Coniophora puteana RWD-64-598 SS2]|uniref:Vacuolar sorting protein Vps3844 C-terminal domain-containing protein n=1 Tax=Coniophora puteana (strain RWD-64-598) TaxID=741705 RepID=A0A5M3MXE0_CONPW|nr:uncharacterized protein CONPUDRAFT_164352 [Coniophora puteana RWD-64-598 SS2]EIW83395.1 hypothetical protein CONPUDRAFT_164352 [Coniophora puteana RWD-64-598 SS2]